MLSTPQAGTFRAYVTDFADERGVHRETFVPFLGEIWDPAEAAPLDSMHKYYSNVMGMVRGPCAHRQFCG